MTEFHAAFRRATGQAPYPWQQHVAEAGLPELLQAETGTGKTAGVVLGWLYRRRFHDDQQVRRRTPHWLVFVLPTRVLVEQTVASVRSWLERLGLTEEVALHRVLGGEGRLDTAWRLHPTDDAVFVGTLDMLISRALNRGYGSSRFAWAMDFGLFNSGCHWVFDEIQLMGPALPTSRQLDGLRQKFGTAAPCTSTWMSATVDLPALGTFDNRTVTSTVSLTGADRSGGLAARLNATRIVRRLPTTGDKKHHADEIATGLAAAHREGTLSIAICNTVDVARDVWRRLADITKAKTVLLHSRFRPGDRSAQVTAALADVDGRGPGRIVVSTQVIEAGVDISASTLFTEAAPWPSIVQRAGRCNRDGTERNATLLWAPPLMPAPYPASDVEAAIQALDSLQNSPLTSGELRAVAVAVSRPTHPILRRRDLLSLFDTTPDLSANDLDISPYIRDADDLDALVCWRNVPPDVLKVDHEVAAVGEELCPVPVGGVRDALKIRRAWRHDHLAKAWVPARAADVRPGMIVLLSAAEGGYSPVGGWEPKLRDPVPVTSTANEQAALSHVDEATDDDVATFAPERWVTLLDHLADVEAEVWALLEVSESVDLPLPFKEAAAAAGRLHDLGKAHEVFQDTMRRSAQSQAEVAMVEARRPLAKSGGPNKARHSRRYFRHELVSALALLAEPGVLGGIAEPDLVIYLVGAHHGRVRMGLRSLPGERATSGGHDARVALGVHEGDRLDTVELPGGTMPATVLSLWPMDLGEGPNGRPSWTRMALGLRDRPDLGPFRLGFLEALVRAADWRASAHAGDGEART